MSPETCVFFICLLSLCTSFLIYPSTSSSRTVLSRRPLHSQPFALRAASPEGAQYYSDQDAYQILGVSRTATKSEIKSAYRKLVTTWHPDKFPDDENKKKEGGQRMEKINRAYYCLEDEERRKRYDAFGEQGVGTSAASEEQLKQSGGPGFGGFGGVNGEGIDLGDISDIFEAFFGGGAQSGRGFSVNNVQPPNTPTQGDDMHINLELPFLTAVFGGQEKIKIKIMEPCSTCGGTGAKPGSKPRPCSTCKGGGTVQNMLRTPLGVVQNRQTCSSCGGSGEEMDSVCPTCRGKCIASVLKEVEIKIPPGVNDGATLRVRDGGNAGKRGGRRGDLYAQISVRSHPKFKRNGLDINSEEEVLYTDALLGTTVAVDTVDGPVELRVPGGTQPGQRLRIKGKGVFKLGTTTRGDAYITVKVKMPLALSEQERRLVEELRNLTRLH